MELLDKLTILADAAKYDAACTSSGVGRAGRGGMGSALPAGGCHFFSADGRCISLLKGLYPQGAVRAHHGLLPPQLHRGALPLLRRPP